MKDSAFLESEAYIYVLASIRGLGASRLERLLRLCPNPDVFTSTPFAVLATTVGQQLALELDYMRTTHHWNNRLKCAYDLLQKWHEQGIGLVPLNSPLYPPLLRCIKDPPPILYVRGHSQVLAETKTVTIVGTRNPTEIGREIARRVAQHFAAAGYVIISGLAKGIDAAAHRGALAAPGKTVAVLGTPVDKVSPAENRNLADLILDHGGALISEYQPGRSGSKHAFIRRNRIQSGMSLAVIPIQTDVKGGTMHTVRFAQEQMRPVFCPRPVENESALPQWAGIRHLLDGDHAVGFDRSGYDKLHIKMQRLMSTLLSRCHRG